MDRNILMILRYDLMDLIEAKKREVTEIQVNQALFITVTRIPTILKI